MGTIGKSKLDEKARIVLPGSAREAPDLKVPDKYKGSIGSIAASSATRRAGSSSRRSEHRDF